MSTDPYKGLLDEQVLATAAAALRKVSEYPVGSVERAIQWGVYEHAKAELDMRFYAHVVSRIRSDDDL